MEKVVFEHISELGSKNVVRTREGLCLKNTSCTPNWHEAVEILFFFSGNGSMLLDDRRFKFEAGNIYIVNSQVIHSFTVEEEMTYAFVQISKPFFAANNIDLENVNFCEYIEKDEFLQKEFKALRELSLSVNNPLKTAKESRSALNIMIYLLENYSVSSKGRVSRDEAFERVKKVMLYIKQNFEKEITLEELSLVAGINKYQLTREFKALTGDSVFEFINSFRCKVARRNLKNGKPVTEAALLSGFSNLSYFSRTYRKHIGELPRETKQRT